MPFRNGTISYARYHVSGGPNHVDLSLLEKLREGAMRPVPIGTAEIETGWVAGRHVLDVDFEPETLVYADALLFGLRIDTNRVPADLKRAYRALAEEARRRESATGEVGRTDRRAAKEEADERCREELATGRHRKSKLVPVLWDVARHALFAPTFGDAAQTALVDLFRATFEATLEPRTSGALAGSILESRGRTRDYEDLRPSPFMPPPAAAHGDETRQVAIPAVPWTWSGPEPKDFLGNEFLIWLWHEVIEGAGVFETQNGPIAVAVDRLLETQCAWDVTGQMSLRADGPARLPEARRALALGKWPRKAGLLMAHRGESWEITFQADRFLVTGAKLPKPEEPYASEREAVEARLSTLDTLDRALVSLFTHFLDLRTGASWTTTRERLSKWIANERLAPSGSRPDIVATVVGATVPPPAVEAPADDVAAERVDVGEAVAVGESD